jgi:hypothetical protein
MLDDNTADDAEVKAKIDVGWNDHTHSYAVFARRADVDCSRFVGCIHYSGALLRLVNVALLRLINVALLRLINVA